MSSLLFFIIINSFLFLLLFFYLQFGRRYYYQQYLSRGSWLDAERKCNSIESFEGHLWSINSHSEWWNVFYIIGIEFYDIRRSNKVFRLQDDVLLSTVSFIGLQRYDQVRQLMHVKVSHSLLLILLVIFILIAA